MTDVDRDKTSVAFLGIGNMGFHMANCLVAAGYRVTGWSRSKQDFAEQAHFSAVTDLARALDGASIVILCLRDQHAVDEVLTTALTLQQLEPGSLVIDMGTSGIDSARHHSETLVGRSIGYLDAPVSGGTGGARDASLSIFVGGSPADFARGKDALSAMGSAVHLGPAGAGQAAKLANQIIVGISIAALAEGLSFAEAQGIDPTELLKALDGGFASSRVLDVHGPRIAKRDYSAAGAVKLHLKDLRLAAEASSFVHLPHASLVKIGFENLAATGKDGLDHSAYATLYQTDER